MEADMCGLRAADRNFRKHLIWYTKGLEEASRFRQLIGALSDRERMLIELDKYFQCLSEPGSK
jgi:tRNA-dihydrouridine synthase B